MMTQRMSVTNPLLMFTLVMIGASIFGMGTKLARENPSQCLHCLWAWNDADENEENFNVKTMQDYLDKGGKIDERDAQGVTPMQAAIYGNKKLMVSWLVHKGANLNSEDENGNTPLCLAVRPYPPAGKFDNIITFYQRKDIIDQLIEVLNFKQMANQQRHFFQLLDRNMLWVRVNAQIRGLSIDGSRFDEQGEGYRYESILRIIKDVRNNFIQRFTFLSAAQILNPIGITSDSKTLSESHVVMKQYICGWDKHENSDPNTVKTIIQTNKALQLLLHLHKKNFFGSS